MIPEGGIEEIRKEDVCGKWGMILSSCLLECFNQRFFFDGLAKAWSFGDVCLTWYFHIFMQVFRYLPACCCHCVVLTAVRRAGYNE